MVHYCNPIPDAQFAAQLSAVTAERDALAKERWSVVATRNGAIEERDAAQSELSELRARVAYWRKLAKEAVEEFEDARGYAGDYFTDKWGYDVTSAEFKQRIAFLEGDEK